MFLDVQHLKKCLQACQIIHKFMNTSKRRQFDLFEWMMLKTGGEKPDFEILSNLAVAEFGYSKRAAYGYLYRAWLAYGRGQEGKIRRKSYVPNDFESFLKQQEKDIVNRLECLKLEVRILKQLLITATLQATITTPSVACSKV